MQFSAPRLVHVVRNCSCSGLGRCPHNGDPLWNGAPTRQARQNPSCPIPRAGRHGNPSALSPPAEACLRTIARKSSEHWSCMSPRGDGPGLSWLHWGTHCFLGGLVMAPRAPGDCGTSLTGPCGTSTTICSHPADIHPQKSSSSGMSGPTVTSRWQGGATDSPPVRPSQFLVFSFRCPHPSGEYRIPRHAWLVPPLGTRQILTFCHLLPCSDQPEPRHFLVLLCRLASLRAGS